MKKLLSLLLTSALTVAVLAGCGGGGDTTTTETADTGDGKVYNVCNLVMVTWVTNLSLTLQKQV